MTENRDKLLAKIKALFAKTENAGATEAEALAAAEKAHELIERYQIDLGAGELKREGFIKRTIEVETSRFTFARRILNGIDKFCEVKTWIWNWRPDEEEDRVLYRIRGATDIYVIGLASDTEFAAYLIESLTMFAMGGVTPHIAAQRKMAIALGTPLTASDSREVRRSYLLGCANRISLRLREMAQQRKAQAAKPGSYGALITLDQPSLIKAEMDRLDIRLSAGSCLTGAGDRGSFEAGSAHGAKATFGRPVAGGRIAGLIGRK